MRIGLALLTGAVLLNEAQAQVPRPFALGTEGGARTQALQPSRGVLQNGVTTLETQGDSLWAGPLLNLTADGGRTWQVAATDSVLRVGGDNALFSLDIEGDTLWAGLGRGTLGGEAAASGFLVSRDGGETFARRDVPLDTGAPEDRVLLYGVSVLPTVPVIRPEGSSPFAVDVDPASGTVWTAGRLSGLRRSIDGGQTWQRAVLPPDSLSSIRPDSAYGFTVGPATTAGGFFNHVAFSVLVDETGTVWAGTVAGVNRSRPEDVFLFETEDGTRFTERAWQRFDADNAGLAADQVTVLEEQPLAGRRNPVWMASLVARDQADSGAEQERGVTVTPDGGQTFRTTLLERRVNDFAFRGDTVYAAADEGLFITTDAGMDWREVHPSLPDRFVAPDLRILAVAATPGALWAGTFDGLFKSTDEGTTWQVFRADVPLDPEQPTERIPEVATYAYPNPFAPNEAPSGRVRIVVEAEGDAEARVEIYDAGMALVQTLRGDCPGGGRCEVGWDGTDDGGLRVANGVYFYRVEAGSETARGKILVME